MALERKTVNGFSVTGRTLCHCDVPIEKMDTRMKIYCNYNATAVTSYLAKLKNLFNIILVQNCFVLDLSCVGLLDLSLEIFYQQMALLVILNTALKVNSVETRQITLMANHNHLHTTCHVILAAQE